MALNRLLAELAEPHRRRLWEMVQERDRSSGDLHRALGGPTFGAVSQHLARLRRAGLVEVRVEGRNRYYRARPEALHPLKAWLEAFGGGRTA